MSIILKGIDIPNSGQIEIIIRPHGKVFSKTRGISAEAIQIPKGHGAIKDINTFLKDKSLYEHIENVVFNKTYSYVVGIGAIYNAPTILEAEEEE